MFVSHLLFVSKRNHKKETKMVKELYNRLGRLERILEDNKLNEAIFLNIDEASDFIKMKKSSIYQLVYHRKIPFYKRGKLLLFKKAELVRWIEEKKMDTFENLANRANLNRLIDNGGNNGESKTNYSN